MSGPTPKLPPMPEPPGVLPHSSLECITTDEALQAYVDESIRCTLGDGWPFGLNKGGKGMSPAKLWSNYDHAIQVLNDLRVELTSCAKRIHNQRSEIGRLTFELAEARPAREAAQSIEQTKNRWTIDEAQRELEKWLNEKPNRPVDRSALATVLAHLQAKPAGAPDNGECPTCGAMQVNGEPAIVEAWCGERKVTVYPGQTVLKSWGMNMETEMLEAPHTLQNASDAFDWLYLSPLAVPTDPERLRKPAAPMAQRDRLRLIEATLSYTHVMPEMRADALAQVRAMLAESQAPAQAAGGGAS